MYAGYQYASARTYAHNHARVMICAEREGRQERVHDSMLYVAPTIKPA